MQPSIKESDRRKPDAAGIKIRLIDGQDWLFREPIAYFELDDADEDRGVSRRFDLGPDYDALFKVVADHKEDEPYFAWVSAVMRCGRFLLLANYTLTPAEANAVLRFTLPKVGEEGDRDSDRVWLTIRNLVLGVSEPPKPSGDGSGSR